MIAGHEAVTDGDILIHGENVSDLPPVARGTAMMFQSYALFPHMNCLDNVAFSLKMRGVGQDGAARQGARVPRRWCIWRTMRRGCRRNCPAASSSASPWRGR